MTSRTPGSPLLHETRAISFFSNAVHQDSDVFGTLRIVSSVQDAIHFDLLIVGTLGHKKRQLLKAASAARPLRLIHRPAFRAFRIVRSLGRRHAPLSNFNVIKPIRISIFQ